MRFERVGSEKRYEYWLNDNVRILIFAKTWRKADKEFRLLIKAIRAGKGVLL